MRLEEDVLLVPRRYGLEYEIQLMLRCVETGDAKTVAVMFAARRAISEELIFLSQYAGARALNLRNTWVVQFPATFLASTPTLVTEDMGNLEIRNVVPLQTIDACVKELNEKVDILGGLIAEAMPTEYQFALLLPKCAFTLGRVSVGAFNRYGGLKCFGYLDSPCLTKHLNFSYDTQEELLRQCRVVQNMAQRGALKRRFGHTLVTTKASDVKGSSDRIHLRLPYDFKDYEKVFNGELTVEPYRNSKVVLLGHSSKHLLRGKRPWRRINQLV